MKYDIELLPTLFHCYIDKVMDYEVKSIEDNIVVLESADKLTDGAELFFDIFEFRTEQYHTFSYKFKIVEVIHNTYTHSYKIRILDNMQAMTIYLDKIHNILADEDTKETIPDLGTIQTIKFKQNELSNYPYEKDSCSKDFVEQEQDWFHLKKVDASEYEDILKDVSLSFYVNNYIMYNCIAQGTVNGAIKHYLEEKKIAETGIFAKQFDRLYVGNEFCPNLFPEKELLFTIMDKCLKENMNITLAFPYLLQSRIIYTRDMLEAVNEWCNTQMVQVEVIVNDYGMFELLKGKECLVPVLGRLMNKRKKDPRIEHLWGFSTHKELLTLNNLDADFYMRFLNNYGILRYEYEDYCIPNHINGARASLHFPYYQVNTSVFCPLYAQCQTGSRHKQTLVEKCSRYCEHFVFQYPDHLKMVGIQNSIFGFRKEIFEEPEYVKRCINDGVDRFVYEAF